MNAKEKAKELIEKYSKVEIQIGGQYDGYLSMQIHDAKECSLMAIEEILNHHSQEQGLYRIDTYYWQQVKSELQSL